MIPPKGLQMDFEWSTGEEFGPWRHDPVHCVPPGVLNAPAVLNAGGPPNAVEQAHVGELSRQLGALSEQLHRLQVQLLLDHQKITPEMGVVLKEDGRIAISV
jgi:hypothetical protein